MATAAVGQVPTWWQAMGPMVGAVIGAVVALATARLTYRASENTNNTALLRLDHDRDAAIDARTDKALSETWAQLASTRADLEHRTAAFWDLSERHQRLRLAVIRLGYDPDALDATGGLNSTQAV